MARMQPHLQHLPQLETPLSLWPLDWQPHDRALICPIRSPFLFSTVVIWTVLSTTQAPEAAVERHLAQWVAP